MISPERIEAQKIAAQAERRLRKAEYEARWFEAYEDALERDPSHPVVAMRDAFRVVHAEFDV